MTIALWIVQGLLAALFLAAGIFKSTQPKEKLAEKMEWVNDFPGWQIKVIGVLQVLAAIGLIVPQITGIAPVLTPLAAVGLILTMIGAMVVHLRREELNKLPVNAALLVLAAFVAYGRF